MDIQKIIDSLSPNEKKILPHLKEKNVVEICKGSKLDKVSVLRALEFLQNKKIIQLSQKRKKIVDIGVNGALYRKKGLPERRLLELLEQKRIVNLKDAQKEKKLTNDEFKAAIGALKKKAMIELKSGKIILNANKEEISKKSLEEILIESLPIEYDSLRPEQLHALKLLQSRKDIVQVTEEKKIEVEITELGNKLSKMKIKDDCAIEQVTQDMLKNEKLWKGKKFRRYDIEAQVPKIAGGKTHFVNQASEYARKIWTDMGFKEMTGTIIQSSFWNFDALFTPQDHPVREMQDTFFIDKKAHLPNKKITEAVKKSHEGGIDNSKGWGNEWIEKEAEKTVLRTHTTCLSAQTLSKLKKEELPKKFFALGINFRNETVDWSHGFEFNQTEGIVVDKNANFKHLLGYLKQFYTKMGFEKIRFTPAYFPYTEPSVEITVWHPERKVWLELGGAGIFRPEITIPLLGEAIPVLAWGQGFDRMITDYYNIKDLRELYKNNLTQLRKMKIWIK